MRNILRKKLHSHRAASIVIAMVVFLIVSMISLVIVQAALTNAARVKTQQESEQGYLNVSSAAELLENEILIGDDTATEAKQKYRYILCSWTTDADGNRTYGEPECGDGFKDGNTTTLYGEILLSMVKEWVNASNTDKTITPHELEFTVAGADTDATQAFGKVTAKIGASATDSAFDLVCILKDESGYTMRVYFNGSVTTDAKNRMLLYFTTAEVMQ